MPACILLQFLHAAIMGSTAFGGDQRPVLEDALAECRLRDLGLIAAHEAWRTHAETLANEPEKSAIAWCYAGMVEVIGRDLESARTSFQKAKHLLAKKSGEPDHETGRLIEQGLRDCDASSTQSLSAPRSPAERPAIDVREVTLGGGEQPAGERLGGLTPSRSELTFRFDDPWLLVEPSVAALKKLPEKGTSAEERLIAAWRGVLDRDAEALKESLRAVEPDVRDRDAPQRAEWLCLSLVADVWSKDQARIEVRVKEIEGLPAMSLWGVRALAFVPRADSQLVAIGQMAVRELADGRHPFDAELLYPQDRREASKAEWRRDWYWEVGALHGERAIADQGFWPARWPRLPARRAARLLSEMTSPLRQAEGTPLTKLRLATWGTACARAGDFESWWNDQVLPEHPVWRKTLRWARIASGASRTRSAETRSLPEAQTAAVESPEVLLAGEDPVPASTPVAAGRAVAGPPARTAFSWVWVLAVLLGVLIVIGAAGWLGRR